MGKFIGLMSGTSADAIDAALINISNESNTLSILKFEEYPHSPEIRNRLKIFHTDNTKISLHDLTELDQVLAEAFSDATCDLLKRARVRSSEIKAIGCHGQTIFHKPNPPYPSTLQLGDANVIAQRTGITTVADFRRMDMAAGGQGAPLAPAFHAFYFRNTEHNRVILNLGGIANITYLPKSKHDRVSGFDTGPANALMDEWIKRHQDLPYDQDGKWSLQGKLIPDLLEILLSDHYFSLPAPKSTGREYFNPIWLKKKLEEFDQDVEAVDVQTTLRHLTAKSIALSVQNLSDKVDQLIACGGGAYNSALLKTISEYLPGCEIIQSDLAGVPAKQVEAVAFAWLAHQRVNNRPGNIPSVTGANRALLLGGIYQAE